MKSIRPCNWKKRQWLKGLFILCYWTILFANQSSSKLQCKNIFRTIGNTIQPEHFKLQILKHLSLAVKDRNPSSYVLNRVPCIIYTNSIVEGNVNMRVLDGHTYLIYQAPVCSLNFYLRDFPSARFIYTKNELFL